MVSLDNVALTELIAIRQLVDTSDEAFPFLIHTDMLVGLINILSDIIWRFTGNFLAPDFVCKILKYFQVVANVHQMALERRVGPVLDSQVCSPDCPEGLSCRNTAQYPANCSVRKSKQEVPRGITEEAAEREAGQESVL
ncbi:UNVERIFIED_CONTAM: hypothetical protein FKN15_009249 [Acipenser sinensis]